MDTLVSADWLARHLGDKDLVVLDCTVNIEESAEGIRRHSARSDYERGHIPGAIFADLTGALSDTKVPIDLALPAPVEFCAAIGRLGVGDNSSVVLYDTNHSAWAARVWWMLRWVGFDQAAILNGGFADWTSRGNPVETGKVHAAARTLTPHPRPNLIASAVEVADAMRRPEVRIIDSLPPELFTGTKQVYARAGHIPTAENVCSLNYLDEGGNLRANNEISTITGGDKATRTITYCGGGILASLSAFAMTRAGYTDIAVYAASRQERAADPSRPMTTTSD